MFVLVPPLTHDSFQAPACQVLITESRAILGLGNDGREGMLLQGMSGGPGPDQTATLHRRGCLPPSGEQEASTFTRDLEWWSEELESSECGA